MTKRTVTTKRNGAKRGASNGTKRAERPIPFKPTNGIERAAKRAGIEPAAATPPGDAMRILEEMTRDGLTEGRILRSLVTALSAEGCNDATLARVLRWEAGTLERLAQRLTPPPEVRDSMLADALEIVTAAEAVFYVDGVYGSTPEAIMTEALHSLEQDLAGFGSRIESSDNPIVWQELWRAADRAGLARKLAAFRRKHGEYKPATKDDQSEEAVAS